VRVIRGNWKSYEIPGNGIDKTQGNGFGKTQGNDIGKLKIMILVKLKVMISVKLKVMISVKVITLLGNQSNDINALHGNAIIFWVFRSF